MSWECIEKNKGVEMKNMQYPIGPGPCGLEQNWEIPLKGA